MSSTKAAPTTAKTPSPKPGGSGPRQVQEEHGFGIIAERLALPVVFIAIIVVFSVLKPAQFASWSNVSNILGSQAVLFVLALAALMPSITGDFDLSLGGVMGLTAVVVGNLNTESGMNIWLAALIGVAVAVLAGIVNGFFVVTCDTNPLITTLGMGTVLTGLIYYVAGSKTIVGIDDDLTRWTFTAKLFDVPFEFWYGVIIMMIIWWMTTYHPLGLRALFVGQSRDVARLSGIRVSRIRFGGFVLGGFIAGLAGLLFLGTTGSADPTASGPYLLPAYAAVFLGATSIKPGRFNALGTGLAVYFLATGTTGLQILGAQNYVQQLFYGAALVLAVVLSRQIRRNR
ncbi:ABC transporter permease [Nocardioides sp. DS6]|uniref:Autoinducer 2 import system permease protein LsrC n=1 Tax=Nocardioides eburneus TaxID=3231482 RepID=A0ABV3SUW5_9ACTN